MLILFLLPFIIILANKAAQKFSWLLASFFLYEVVFTLINVPQSSISVIFHINFTLEDLFFFFMVVTLIAKRPEIKQSAFFSIRSNFLYLIFFIVFIIFLYVAFSKYGLISLFENRFKFYQILFFFLLIRYAATEKNLSLYYKYLYYLFFFTLIIYFLRISGALELPRHYQNIVDTTHEAKWNQFRFLSNLQVFELIMLVIIYGNYSKLSSLSNYIFFIAVFLILTSTQRTLTLFFLFYLLANFILSRYSKLRRSVFSILILSVITYLVFVYNPLVKNQLADSFLDISENYEGSNAKFKIIDVPLVLASLIQQDAVITGIQKFNIDRGNLEITMQYDIHNDYLIYLVFGGLILFIPLFFCWLFFLLKYFMLIIKNTASREEKIAFWWLLLAFVFNNTSGLGYIGTFILAYAGLLLYKRKINSLSILPSSLNSPGVSDS